MVCLGNICRSPMADGLLRKKVADAGLEVTVDSAGTADYHVGEAPDSRMCATAASFGYPIDALRARQFVLADFDRFDRIYAMDASNFANILRLARHETDASKVQLILNEIYPDQHQEVPDPYYGGEKGFIKVFNLLDSATDAIVQSIQS